MQVKQIKLKSVVLFSMPISFICSYE